MVWCKQYSESDYKNIPASSSIWRESGQDWAAIRADYMSMPTLDMIRGVVSSGVLSRAEKVARDYEEARLNWCSAKC